LEILRDRATPLDPSQDAEGSEAYVKDPDGIWIELLE